MTTASLPKSDIAGAFRAFLDLHQFDRLGGSGSFFGRQHVLATLLREAHEAAGERWRGMQCYMNCVCPEPTLAALRAWKDLGYTREQLFEQTEFWTGQRTPDAVVLDVIAKHYAAGIYGDAVAAVSV